MLILAPMQGLTELLFRRVYNRCYPGAFDYAVSPFLSLTHGNLKVADKKIEDVLPALNAGSIPIVPQLLGHEPDEFVDLANLNLSGIVNASKDDEGFKRALWALLASIAFGVVAAILENSNAKVASWLKVPSTLFELVVTIYVLEGIGNLARNLGKNDIADLSKQCRTWMMCALVLSAAAEVFVAVQAAESTLKTTSGIAASLLGIVAYVVYLWVLNKARLMQ